jgi:phosphoribosylaminoimidazolecarboxamide formyltransferase / IMP cyclohydrolase
MTDLRIRRALISVSDKTGLEDLARRLSALRIEILSTGGTYKALAALGLPVIEVSAHTGFPEIMEGRVKTLHPRIHGGLLARRDTHAADMVAHDIPPIDLLVVNLYPFESTLAAGADRDTCVENIDIGGPAMIRGASKNHDFVAVVTDTSQYADLLAALETSGGQTSLALRRKLAAAAFARTAAYDAAIADWMAQEEGETLPARLTLTAQRQEVLRYGENPHQSAAFYLTGERRPGVATARQLQGKSLSYNNINDTDAAFELVSEFQGPAVAIIKHANPCGVAQGDTLEDAYLLALRCDPVSAFGGIVAVNRTLDAATAARIAELFTEVIVAPDVTPEAQAIIARKKNLRLLVTGGMADPAAPGRWVKTVSGGLLVQQRDAGRVEASALKVVTQRAPTAQELADLLFAFRVGKHVKSNAIVYAKDGATVGIGAGQMSRVDSCRIAASKAREAADAAGIADSLAVGSVVASDAFFPFADGLLAAVEAGATAVIQPGGSVRDGDVIAAADAHGLAMVLTGMRHFRH